MRRKLLSLFVLLFIVNSGAWAVRNDNGNTIMWDFTNWTSGDNTENGLTMSVYERHYSSGSGYCQLYENHYIKFHAILGQKVIFYVHSYDDSHSAHFKVFIDGKENDTKKEYSVKSLTEVTYVIPCAGDVVFQITNNCHTRLNSITLISGATYEISGNPLDVITFTGTGDLFTNVFNMANWTLEVGNVEEGDQPKVGEFNGTKYAYVVDHFDGHMQHVYLPGKFPQAGTFYVIKPKTDGRLSLNVLGDGSTSESYPNASMVLLDIDGNKKSTIHYGEYQNINTTVSFDNLQAGKIYYLYAEPWIVLRLHQATFYKATEKTLEFTDYDSGEETGEYTWEANQTKRAVVANDGNNEMHQNYAMINFGSDNPRSVIYPFTGLGSQREYKISFDAVLDAADNAATQLAIYTKIPSYTVNEYSEEVNQYVDVQYGDVAATDYLFALSSTNSQSWTVSIPNNTNSSVNIPLVNDAHPWCHFEITVNHRTNKLTYKITKITSSNGSQTIQSSKTVDIPDGLSNALGLSFFTGGNNAIGKFDNIKVSSAEEDLGTLSAPRIEIVGTTSNGRGRIVRIYSGLAENPNNLVTTFWSTAGDTYGGEGGWNRDHVFFNTTNVDDRTTTLVPGGTYKEFTFYEPTTLTVRSVVLDGFEGYQWNGLVESETVSLYIPAGSGSLGGSIEVMGMSQTSTKYLTPILRFYADTRFLTQDEKNMLQITVNWIPLDYGTLGTDNTTMWENGEVKQQSRTFYNNEFTTKTNEMYSFDNYIVGQSGTYWLTISAPGTDCQPYDTKRVNYYRDKYKLTYQTPDFRQVEDPTSYFADINDEKIGEWNDWEKFDGQWFQGWGWYPYQYVWTNAGSNDKTTPLNSVKSAQSRASAQTYNLRTVQKGGSNQLRFIPNYGLMKDTDQPWDYHAQLAHVGMGNEIPMYTYAMPSSDNSHDNPSKHELVTKYPTPFINSSNVPEVYFTIPARAALVKYQVYTPVEVKHVSNKGLATFSSYYSLYSVDDIYMDNDEKINTYRTQTTTYKYGGNYKLIQTWYCENHEGLLLAANEYEGSNLWEKTGEFERDGYPWDDTSYDVELRIIDAVTEGCWKENNEMKAVLFDGDNGSHSTYPLYASSTYDPNSTSEENGLEGHPRLILTSGKNNKGTDQEVVCYNFFTMPEISNWANMVNKSSYIEPVETKYKDFHGYPKTQGQAQGIKVYIGDCEFEDESVGIEDVLVNSAEVARMNDDAFYTISGQKVSNPTSGLYIHNGKKVLVK